MLAKSFSHLVLFDDNHNMAWMVLLFDFGSLSLTKDAFN